MLADAARFASMRRDAALLGSEMNMIFDGGSGRFLYKGTKDRWREDLTANDRALLSGGGMHDARAETLAGARRSVGGRTEEAANLSASPCAAAPRSSRHSHRQ